MDFLNVSSHRLFTLSKTTAVGHNFIFFLTKMAGTEICQEIPSVGHMKWMKFLACIQISEKVNIIYRFGW